MPEALIVITCCGIVIIGGLLFMHSAMKQGDKYMDRPEIDPQWSPPDVTPPAPGSYKTRVINQPKYGIGRAKWDGEKWRYPDGNECYFQKREWQDLTGAAS